MVTNNTALIYRVKARKSRVQAENAATIKGREEHLKLAADYDALATFYERTAENEHKSE
jgi:hypothetical protein